MRCLTQQFVGRKYDLWMWPVNILAVKLHSLSHNEAFSWNLYALRTHYQSQSEYFYQNKPCAPTYAYCIVRFYLCAHQGLDSENVTQEEHAVCLNQPPLILKGAGENGKLFSEWRIINALFKKLIGLILFLFAQIITDSKENIGNVRCILVLPWRTLQSPRFQSVILEVVSPITLRWSLFAISL